MEPSPPLSRVLDRALTVRVALALGLSLALHGGIVGYLAYSNASKLDFAFRMPTDVEFGITEGRTVELPGQNVPVPAAPPSQPPAAPADNGGVGVGLDAGVASDAGQRRRRRDAGLSDGGVDEGGIPSDGGDDDAGRPLLVASSGEADAGGGEGTLARAPTGAQLALRMDMAHVRASAFAPVVATLLQAIPDWGLLLDGSEIDPIATLDKLMIAGPNIQRENLIVAGSYVGEEGLVREAVARMGAARNVEVAWRSEHGVPVAPWANADATERVVALVGPREFAIARPQDLERVLAVAAVRGETPPDNAAPRGIGEALLSMEPGDALTVEAEGVEAYWPRGLPNPPRSARLAVREQEDGSVLVVARARFSDAPRAAESAEFWQRLREQHRFLIALMGYGPLVGNASLRHEGDTVVIESTLTAADTRALLERLAASIRDSVERMRRRALERGRPGLQLTPTPTGSAPPTAP